MIKVYTWYIPGIYQEKHFKGFQMGPPGGGPARPFLPVPSSTSLTLSGSIRDGLHVLASTGPYKPALCVHEQPCAINLGRHSILVIQSVNRSIKAESEKLDFFKLKPIPTNPKQIPNEFSFQTEARSTPSGSTNLKSTRALLLNLGLPITGDDITMPLDDFITNVSSIRVPSSVATNPLAKEMVDFKLVLRAATTAFEQNLTEVVWRVI